MKPSPLRVAQAAILILSVVGIDRVLATPIARGFVSETPREFEYNSGFLVNGDYLYETFSVFGAYPGHFDLLNIEYSPEDLWDNDCLVVVGTFSFNSYYWSGDNISGNEKFFEFGAHPLLTVVATYQDAILNTSVGNVNIRGYYSGYVAGEDTTHRVPESGSTLVLLGGALAVCGGAGAVKRRSRNRRLRRHLAL